MDEHIFSELASRHKGAYLINARLSITYILSAVLESMRDKNAILPYFSYNIRHPQTKPLDKKSVPICVLLIIKSIRI